MPSSNASRNGARAGSSTGSGQTSSNSSNVNSPERARLQSEMSTSRAGSGTAQSMRLSPRGARRSAPRSALLPIPDEKLKPVDCRAVRRNLPGSEGSRWPRRLRNWPGRPLPRSRARPVERLVRTSARSGGGPSRAARWNANGCDAARTAAQRCGSSGLAWESPMRLAFTAARPCRTRRDAASAANTFHSVASRSKATLDWLGSRSVTACTSHAAVGQITVDWELLASATDPEQQLFVLTAEPGSASHRALRFLARVAAADPHP
jgi:hypothetical protein